MFWIDRVGEICHSTKSSPFYTEHIAKHLPLGKELTISNNNYLKLSTTFLHYDHGV